MPRLLRLLFALAAGAGARPSGAQPAPVPAPAAPTLTAAEEAELAALAALPTGAWERTGTVRASFGWRDNILLSPFAPVARSFARGEVEAMLWRPPHRQWEFLSFLNGDVLRYLSPPAETGGEQQWFAHGEARWQPRDALRLALKADGFFQDTVIDLSETEATRFALPARTHGGIVTVALRLALPAGFSVEPLAQAKRTRYREIPGDHREMKAGARLEWTRGERLTVSAAWHERSRRYADRNEYTAGGRALPGTQLRFTQREAELRTATQWTAGGKWRATVTVGRLENRDGASGYFDYDQDRLRLEVGWERAAWAVTLDGEAKRLEYRVQTVGTGIAPPPRRADAFATTLRAERSLDAAWMIFAEHHWERDRANQPEFSYRANTVLAGVQRSF